MDVLFMSDHQRTLLKPSDFTQKGVASLTSKNRKIKYTNETKSTKPIKGNASIKA